MIDVLRTFSVVKSVYEELDEACGMSFVQNAFEKGGVPLTNQKPELAVYCGELGIDPLDLEIRYFFQRKITTIQPYTKKINLFTANLFPPYIATEGEMNDVRFGNFFGMKNKMATTGEWWADESTDSALLLHQQAELLLSSASPGYKWHLEMALIADGKERKTRDPYLVQARRIPIKDNFFIIGEKAPIGLKKHWVFLPDVLDWK